MKKVLVSIIFICSFICCPVMADDVDLPSTGELWDNWNTSQDFYGQDKPAVSDEDFNKALESVKNKQNKLGNWLKKRQIPKGEDFSQSNETEIINQEIDTPESLPVVCIPVELRVGDGILPIGHYQVQGEKDENGNVVLKLYQAQYLMAQFEAEETNDDFGEDTISFVKWLPEGDDKIKIVYGSMDFNAYTIIPIK